MRHKDSLFCAQHLRCQSGNKSLQYGRYDRVLHEEALRKCLHRAAACDQTENFRLYSREKMWDEAAKHGVDSVEELSDELYTACLCSVNEYYGKHPYQWKTLQRLTESAGPRSVEDRHDHERAFYCGTIQRFRYYAPSVFRKKLENLVGRTDVSVSEVSERIFMEALRRTSDSMKDCHIVRGIPLYMGPQCISHRGDEARMRFVPREEHVSSKSASSSATGHRCLDMLQCGCCKRWRRVDEQTLLQFSNETWSIDQLHQERLAFDQQFPGFEGDLRRWLGEVRSSRAEARTLSLEEFLFFSRRCDLPQELSNEMFRSMLLLLRVCATDYKIVWQ